jgi:hypothetical protein
MVPKLKIAGIQSFFVPQTFKSHLMIMAINPCLVSHVQTDGNDSYQLAWSSWLVWQKCPLSGLFNSFMSMCKRGLQSFFVPPTFQSHHNDNQPLLHGPNKQMETIVIILVLVGVVTEPIEWPN